MFTVTALPIAPSQSSDYTSIEWPSVLQISSLYPAKNPSTLITHRSALVVELQPPTMSENLVKLSQQLKQNSWVSVWVWSVSEWVGECVSEWAGEWVSEWVGEWVRVTIHPRNTNRRKSPFQTRSATSHFCLGLILGLISICMGLILHLYGP